LIRDLNSRDTGEPLNAAVAIIGGGAAGITLAITLAERQIPTLVLEAGDTYYSDESQDFYKGEVYGRPYAFGDLTRVRIRALGGSTNHWTGWCRPLDPVDFEPRFDDPLSGWPFGAEALAPYYERAQTICELGPLEYSGVHWAQNIGLPTLLSASGKVESSVLQLSTPTNFRDVYQERLDLTPNLELVVNATLTDLLSADDGATIRAARLKDASGREFICQADYFVLAAGGLENPRILLNATAQGDRGLGNGHDLVGRFFMEHPFLTSAMIAVTQATPAADFYFSENVTPEPRRGDSGGVLGVQGILRLRDEVLRSDGLNNAFFWLRSGGSTSTGMKTALRRGYNKLANWSDLQDIDRDVMSVMGSLELMLNRMVVKHGIGEPRLISVTSFIEQRPNYHSRVRLGDERDRFGQRRIALDWQWQSGDKESLRRSLMLLGEEIGAAGLGRLKILLDDDALNLTSPFSPTPIVASHHMGTTRMHDNPRWGVVDATSRVHSTRNLYVAGSSVFPTSGCSNPTLTIVALALRLADHLTEQFE